MLKDKPSRRGATRRNALNKLASLAAQTAENSDGSDDIVRLCALSHSRNRIKTNGSANAEKIDVKVSSIPMSARELEVLVALCRAAPMIQTKTDAETLFNRLAPYVSEAHRQALMHTPQQHSVPPWEILSYHLTAAVLALGLNHSSLQTRAISCIEETIEEFRKSAEKAVWLKNELDDSMQRGTVDGTLLAIQLTVSLLGFLSAISEYTKLWTPEDVIAVSQRCQEIVSEQLMVSVEAALSAIRNARNVSSAVREWKRWIRNYAARGSPLGAMVLQQSLMNIIEETLASMLSSNGVIPRTKILEALLQRQTAIKDAFLPVSEDLIERITDLAVDKINFLADDADYLQVSSAWQQRLASQVKASSLRCYLYCSLMNDIIADSDLLLSWFDAITSDPVQMADEQLAQTVLKSMAILSRTSKSVASTLCRSLPKLLVQGKMPSATAKLAGESLALVLQQLSQDIVISTLYSLGNVLSASGSDKAPGMSPFFDGTSTANEASAPYLSQQGTGSTLSLLISDEEEAGAVYASVIYAICSIAVECHDEQINALVLSILVQKIGRIDALVDARIVTETASLGLSGTPTQFKSLARLYARLASEAVIKQDELLLNAVTDARIRLAASITKDSPLFEIYLTHLLEQCISSGDTVGSQTGTLRHTTNTISPLFRPTALLLSSDLEHTPEFEDKNRMLELVRDAWFNLVVHGFTLDSQSSVQKAQELQILAQYSLPMVDEERDDLPDSSIDLNPVLRRGSGGQGVIEQKSVLTAALPHCEADIKGLSYQECVFLNAALLVTTLKARAGDCSAVLPYFLESKVKKTAMGNVMSAIAMKSVDVYLERALAGRSQQFAAPAVALQLASFFEGACHRIAKVQQTAIAAADRIANQIPSALCHKASLYALLELLSLMWKSCLDAETNEYEWQAAYRSEKAAVSIQASDDVPFRKYTLATFHHHCRQWVTKAINVAPLDVKGMLQAYLEDYEDDGSYGHIALGRSFAVEMGSLIPNTDQRLTSLDLRDVGVNTASDFIAQYTTRQNYRIPEPKAVTMEEWTLIDRSGASRVADLEPPEVEEAVKLRQLAERLRVHHDVPFFQIRDDLHDAAAAISRSPKTRVQLISDLVQIPFILFTKQSINLGISLWLGIVKENPDLESRILAEVATGWEASIRLRKGFFNSSFHHLDPFYVKEEFAPTRWEAINRRMQLTHNLLTPHLRLVYFLSSHFNASRLTSPFIEQKYVRLVRITMLSMKHTVNQPLAREVHFQIMLLALRVLRYSVRITAAARWRLKDTILSAGLAWFANTPKWSFGSSRLQVKTELRILEDVSSAIQASVVAGSGSSSRTNTPSIQTKQELLLLLLSSERSRLLVWISPLGNDPKPSLLAASHNAAVKDTAFLPLVETAWHENPRIAVQLLTRYPHSPKLTNEVRRWVLGRASSALHDPYALACLLGSSLPSDVSSQLKYLLYWAPADPITAVTYFLPAYGNHPFVIQYAVRALESHAVDVTFFYVPQIVQALRYDALGYVARFIVETAKLSQLFAHQIIWNMKANSYKDNDSEVEDPIKPVLDMSMAALINGFSDDDRAFYEREFDFFGRVTGISGTLKPYIKRPKPEKKQKIEEELRKIQVEVGVYLPSNPDGVVIGIDRKSGKPLQSHAKAPFMATFRIRKEDATDIEEDNRQMEETGKLVQRKTYEVWQSAIFKVGDDCRQDVLALQMIAAFRGIFNNIGLDVFVYPNRVTATAPGCGVIDVLPNSISRDMLGREAVNGLYEYFITKYGNKDSIRFQEARSNFIKSMAAYSIISFLLQFKDRHNGNIMVDDAGHILHIDFGFCFDIAPGGVKFERAPFKLSPEMVAVMGGSPQSQPFRVFEELCVRAFLAARQHVEQLSHIVLTMLDSGLPCFKPATMKHFRERFVLEKTEREAADFVRHLVHISERSYSTGVYDYFQLLTNGIPY